jgi:Xaa-Pro aminopeptidase
MDTPITDNPVIRERLVALRAAMKSAHVDALLLPSSDPHLSEYLPERWKAREWFSGFTGSMGTLVVTANEAHLFADSRYWQQALRELSGTDIALYRIKSGASMEHIDWLASKVTGRVAVDAAVAGLSMARTLKNTLAARGIELVTEIDVVASAWPNRPTLPTASVVEHLAPQRDLTRLQKLAATRAAMQEAGASHHVLSTLDDIGYLLNLRGSDVSFNPVFLAHALLTLDEATLFVMPGKLPTALQDSLAQDGVQLRAYDDFHATLKAICADSTEQKQSLLLDPRRVTLQTREAISAAVKVIEAVNPTTFAKSKKTAHEAAHIRHTMEEDAAAMAEFYAWFEQALGRERITEVTIDEKLTEARARRDGFVSRSFATIAGFNANGALNHYRAVAESAAVIEGNGILLIDSGGQYLGGTTDITRVWPIGDINAQQRRDYTLVLKGMIALSTAKFPRGTKSPYLDAIARAPIWAAGYDYGHGTGHGVGYFMNVHEGPQSISQSMPEPHTAMELGMITSIEPGLYRDGEWGMRIENLVLNTDAGNAGFGDFLQFETLTLCPIDTRLIEPSILRADEAVWLNQYHAEVQRRVSPKLTGDARAWLEARCKPLFV